MEFSGLSCIIWDKDRTKASGTRIKKVHMLDCKQEEACCGVFKEWHKVGALARSYGTLQ